jgi:hypothetical protein
LFYNPNTQAENLVRADKVSWMPYDSKTIGLLLEGLRDVLHQKVEVKFDRGTVVGRLIGCRFYMMEVHRGNIFPRYKWWLPYQISGWHEAVPLLIRYETLYPTVLVAEPDKRMPSPELASDSEETRSPPVRMLGNHREWLADLLTVRFGSGNDPSCVEGPGG